MVRHATFDKHRPRSHVIARTSFMNDPCGCVYIPETEEYLLCYQWAPESVTSFGDVWGCCVSKDLIHWQDRPNAIEAGHADYDRLKTFSGSIFAVVEHGLTVLYLFYTSVRALPIHWQQPYKTGCESQSLAISRDFGQSWQRCPANPLLSSPPRGPLTTGWRDPSVSLWPAMSELLDVSPQTKYMTLSSGTRDFGPSVLLYKSLDLVTWEEIGPLFAPKAASRFSEASRLTYGNNFECVSFDTIGGKQFLFMGVEADRASNDRHATRWTLWMCGHLRHRTSGGPEFIVEAQGTFDHDILYAMHLARDKDNQLVQLGWLDEDKNTEMMEQNWSGCIALPRSMSMMVMPFVDTLLRKDQWIVDETNRTMSTLSIKPISGCTLLRTGSTRIDRDFSNVSSSSFELSAIFHEPTVDRIIFSFRKARDSSEATRIIVALQAHRITLDRSKSSLENGNSLDRSAHFQLLEKDVNLRVFCDESVVEVFVNDRVCLSSRIYPSRDSLGMALEFEGSSASLQALKYEAVVYDGLDSAWPDRQS